MAQKQSDNERTGNFPLFNVVSGDFAATVKKGMDEFAKAQKELVGKFQEFELTMARPPSGRGNSDL